MARTPNLGLYKPDPGQPGYKSLHDVNMDILDQLAIQYTGAITLQINETAPYQYVLSDAEAQHGIFNIYDNAGNIDGQSPAGDGVVPLFLFPAKPRGMFIVNNGMAVNSIQISITAGYGNVTIPAGSSALCFSDGTYIQGAYSFFTPVFQLFGANLDLQTFPTMSGNIMQFDLSTNKWEIAMPVSTATAPGASGIGQNPGQILVSNGFLFVTCPDGKWRRVAIATF